MSTGTARNHHHAVLPSRSLRVPVADRGRSHVVVNAVGVRVGESPGGHAVTAGRIKKIIPDRGFGFVRADDGNEVFFHRTELTTVDFDALQEGEQVTFDIVDSPKGPRARNLQKV
jgi:cold shock protein